MTDQYLVFDIETTAVDYNELSPSQQEYIIRGASTDEEKKKKLDEMALSPLTAKAICIGLQLMEKENNEWKLLNRAALALDESLPYEEKREEILSDGSKCIMMPEKRIIEYFWNLLKKYHKAQLVSFNGRGFDAPFLMLRSALFNIRPSRDIMSGTKWRYDMHIDLLDKLCFLSPSSYGATKRFNFDFYARAFGITSPKAEGIDGSKVGEFYKEGRILEIAEYCMRDITATWELYKVWDEYLKF